MTAFVSFILMFANLAECVFITKGLAVFCASVVQPAHDLHRYDGLYLSSGGQERRGVKTDRVEYGSGRQ